MAQKRTLAFIAGTPIVIAGIVFLAGAQEKMLSQAVRLWESLSPGRADAGGEPAPAGKVHPETAAKAARIAVGTSAQRVEQILGPPAMVQAEPDGDPGGGRTAFWMEGDDMIAVRFRGQKVAVVVVTPMRALSPPPGSSGRDDDADEPVPAEADRQGRQQEPPNLQDALRDLAEKMKRRDEAMKKVLGKASKR